MKRTIVLTVALVCAMFIATTAFAQSGKVSGTVKIQSWQFGFSEANGTYGTQLVEGFMKKYPAVTAERIYFQYSDHYTKLKVALAANMGPDIFGLQAGAPLAEFSKFLEPIDKYAERDFGKNWKAKFAESALAQVDKGGPVYALPVAMSFAGALWVDRTLLDSANVQVPKTLAELKAASAKLRAAGQLPMVIGAKDPWINLDVFMGIAGDLAGAKLFKAIEGKASWTDPEFVKAFEIWQSLFKDKVFQDGAIGNSMYMDAYSLWVDGKAPLQPNGSWEMGSFNPSTGDQYTNYMKHARDVVPMPDYNGDGKSAPVLATPDFLYAINKNSKNKEAAWQLLKYAIFEEGQQGMVDSLSFFPAVKGISPKITMTDEQKHIYAQFQEIGKTSLGFREIPYAALKKSLEDQLAYIIIGKSEPAQAAAAMEAASKATKR